MKKENIWILASVNKAKTHNPSFGQDTHKQQTLYAFAWDSVQQAFAFGTMSHYEFSFRWSKFHPCELAVAEDILRYCSGAEASGILFDDWCSQEQKATCCSCGDSLVTIRLNAPRNISFNSMPGPAELNISYYAPSGELENLYLPSDMAESFANNIQKKRRKEIRALLVV